MLIDVGQRGEDGSVWSLIVGLSGEGLSAETPVWVGVAGVEEPLDRFFGSLAEGWRGWQGTREWVGMEGGLAIACRHDGTGTVIVDVRLSQLSGSGWMVETAIPIDAGQQLSEFAKDLERLLQPQR